ncbi:endothelin-converting enzyme-like 1 [Haemaphysalis longicornis]
MPENEQPPAPPPDPAELHQADQKPSRAEEGPSRVDDAAVRNAKPAENNFEKASPQRTPQKMKGQAGSCTPKCSMLSTRHGSSMARTWLWRTGEFVLLSVLVLVSALVLVYLLLVSEILHGRVNVCRTEDCLAHATELLSTLNTLVHPCHDFHAFVCSGRTNHHVVDRPLLERMYLGGIAEGANDLESCCRRDNTNAARVSAGLLFASCLDSHPRNTQKGLAQFREFRRERGMLWPESEQAEQGSAHPLALMLDLAINWNLNFLFDVRLLSLPRGSSSEAMTSNATALLLTRGKLGYVWRKDVRLVPDDPAQYENYVREYYNALSVSGTGMTPKVLRQLEEAIVTAKTDIVSDLSDQAWFPIRKLGSETTTVESGQWLELLNKYFQGEVTWTADHLVVADGPAVLTNVGNLLRTFQHHVLVAGLAWVFIQSHLWAVSGRPDLVFRESPVKWRKYACFEYAETMFGLFSVVERLTRTFEPQEARQQAKGFAHRLKSTAMEKLRTASWIDAASREVALRKEFFPDLLEASRTYRAMRSERLLFAEVYGRRPFSSEQPAKYIYVANDVDVALGLVAPPLYYLNATYAVSYGGLGTFLAEQLARSFDELGRQLDDAGAAGHWWNQGAYHVKAECSLGGLHEGSPNHSEHRSVKGSATF